MSNFKPYANYGYFAFKKESTAAAAVTPDSYMRITGESLVPEFGIQSINEIAGSRERNVRSIQNTIGISGDVEFFVEEKKIGHFLQMLMGAPITQTTVAATSYRHGFIVKEDDKTYTFDIKTADAPWVHRFFGVHASQLKFSREDNAIKVTLSAMPTKAFIVSRVTVAASSGTTLRIDQTSGLTTSDTIAVYQKEDGVTKIAEYTITSVDSETQLTVSTIGATLEVGDLVVIKESTPTYDQCEPFQFMHGTAIYIGNDIDNVSEVTKETFELTLTNDYEQKYGSGLDEADRYPFDVLLMGFMAEGQISKYYNDEYNLDKLRSNDELGVRFFMQGRTAISANAAVKASSTWGATANGFKIEASTAGRAGNDIAVTIVVNSSDNLAASKSGNHILISLANATASKNTGTLIASAVNALSGVDGTAEGTGAEQFAITYTESSQNLGFRLDSTGAQAGTNVVGVDASEKPYLQFDCAAANFGAYFPSNTENEVSMEEIPLTFFQDTDNDDQERKDWSIRIFLHNDVSAY